MSDKLAIGPGVYCPGCATEMGQVVNNKKGMPCLFDGRFMVIEGYTHCNACGRVFYWRSRDYQAEVERRGAGVIPVGAGLEVAAGV